MGQFYGKDTQEINSKFIHINVKIDHESIFYYSCHKTLRFQIMYFYNNYILKSTAGFLSGQWAITFKCAAKPYKWYLYNFYKADIQSIARISCTNKSNTYSIINQMVIEVAKRNRLSLEESRKSCLKPTGADTEKPFA